MTKIKKAFVLAAGLGTRMRPLTDNIPKPMIKAEGRTLIDRALDRLVEVGVEEAIVNTHYKAEVLHEHLAKRNDIKIHISYEPERLETGGGIVNARHLIGDDPLYVMTSDVILTGDGLKKLAAAYEQKLVGVLLLHKVADSYGYDGKGDFDLHGDTMTWRKEGESSDYVYTGLQVLCPKVFDRAEVKAFGNNFPLNKIYKLYLDQFKAVVNTGKWYHIGTPEALKNLKITI